jgi:predicted metal-dependent HD superfamily phosphohydrolase
MHIEQQMKDFVIGLLKSRIPSTFYYHQYKHSLYVMEKAAEIGESENCTEKELELLEVAALWHDTGYINIYQGHEEESCVLAREHLPGYGYSQDDIDKICGMIMATKIPQTPKTKLEEIIADADLEYLGTENASAMAYDLFKELEAINPQLTRETWNKTEIKFLTQHRYFTSFCRENRQQFKAKYLNSLITNKA